jgi:hypothetical protein
MSVNAIVKRNENESIDVFIKKYKKNLKKNKSKVKRFAK